MALENITWVFHDLFKVRFKPFQYSQIVTSGADPSTANAIPADAGWRIRITDIWFVISTSAAQTITFADDTGNVLCIIPASVAVGTYHAEFGPAGIAATVSENVDITASAAGYAGTLVVQGFYEPIGPFTPATL